MGSLHRLGSILIALAVLLQGCATAANLGLFSATDLSGLKPGMTAVEVHEILGDSDETKVTSDGMTERFTYDRGYENPKAKEFDPVFYSVSTLAIFGLLDLMTFGMTGICTRTCQKGWLDLKYDGCGYLVAASESIADDGGWECWSGSWRAKCYGFASRRKPTTLSESLRSGPGTVTRAETAAQREEAKKRRGTADLLAKAQCGDADAQFEIGNRYRHGVRGVNKDHIEATRWLSLASGQGHEFAAVNLERVQENMTVEQIAEAERLISEWEPKDCPAEEIASPSD